MAEQQIRTQVREAIEATSVRRVATALGLSAEATVRLAGGLPVQAGTIAVAEKNAGHLPQASR